MRFSPRSLPHPVLNNGDDIVGFAFQAKFEAVADKQNYYLKIEFHLSHPNLLKLISEQKAQFVVHVESLPSGLERRSLWEVVDFA
jgi:hypothetical protein